MEEKFKYMLRVHCLTYNHAPYIVDAMNGFCSQETNFPYVCTIFDDASTDGEQEIIRNYLITHFAIYGDDVRKEETEDYQLVCARHNTNTNCYFAVFFLKYNHYQIKKSRDSYLKEWNDSVKYIAMCEGDDYWTAQNKLQMQVDFLDSHHDYSMCFHGAKIVLISGSFNRQRLQQFRGLETREYSGEELLKQWIVPTASIVYRSNIKFPLDSRFAVGDLIIRNQCSIEGKVFCFADEMSVYRLNEGSVTSKPFSFDRAFPHMEALIEHFPQYKVYYEHKYSLMIKRALMSRQFFNVLIYLIKHPFLIRYIF